MNEQLVALASVHELLRRHGIDYWLFGGWAVDFYAGAVTRAHSDIDIAVWRRDHDRIVQLLSRDGWIHAPEPDENGGTGYERDGVRLELTFLVRDDEDHVCIALNDGPLRWSDQELEGATGQLEGVTARLMARHAILRDKSRAREDPDDATKDHADFETLRRPSGQS